MQMTMSNQTEREQALAPSEGVFDNDFPPENVMLGEAANIIVQYLQKYGALRGAYKIDRNGDNSPVPTPSMPGYIHLALNQIASHVATPYGGNVSVLIRDLIYLGLGAYAHVLSKYDSGESKFAAHIIRQEELVRQETLLQLSVMSYAYTIGATSRLLRMSIVGDAPQSVLEGLRRLFSYLEHIPDALFRHQVLVLMYGTPEVREAVTWLKDKDQFRHNFELELWSQQLGQIAEQLEEERKGEGT